MEDQKNASDVKNEERGSINSDSYDSGRRRRVEGMKVVVCTVVAQVVVAGMTVLYKMYVDRGMSLRVLVAYRYIFGATLLCPLAFFLERFICIPLQEEGKRAKEGSTENVAVSDEDAEAHPSVYRDLVKDGHPCYRHLRHHRAHDHLHPLHPSPPPTVITITIN